MAKSFSFQATAVFDKLHKKVMQSAEEAVRSVADDILENLRRGISSGGISPVDKYRRKGISHSARWNKKERHDTRSGRLAVRFYNNTVYAPFLYGKDVPSKGSGSPTTAEYRRIGGGIVRAGKMLRKGTESMYRSGGKHLSAYKVSGEPIRHSQLTSKKWNAFLDNAKKELKLGVSKKMAKIYK